ERDELLKKIDRIEGMQSSTVALTEEEQDEEPPIATLPSMDELMASLDGLQSGGVGLPAGGHLLARVGSDDTESTEMISPELVFPDGYADEKEDDEKEDASAESDKPISRLLVFLDAPQPMKFPLYKKAMTIGRSEQADISVPDDFVSRVHARLVTTDSGVVVEDVASRNGITVNSQPTDRYTLRHGDVLGIGKLRFTFIDLSAVPPEE
ncbi:MAG TPA: FHA domain-containing protein, partial [Gammaproteobacteria bacterium]|nr:FHA domain-containing protein [Gammaproteobacteria bacterium]